MRADRRSCTLQEGLSEEDALRAEWGNSIDMVERSGAQGAQRFAQGARRDFGNIWGMD